MTAQKKNISRTILLALAALLLLGGGVAAGYFLLPDLAGGAGGESEAAETIYYCPMHPQIREPEPGVCPICHMDLVPENDPAAMASHAGGDDHGEMIHVTPKERVVAAVATVPAEHRQLGADISGPATVAVNESTHRVVTAWYPGRIERLFVNKTGQYVRKGDPIAEIYSPELTAAQKEYLLAVDAGKRQLLPAFESAGENNPDRTGRGDQLAKAARRRLELLGMSTKEIDDLEKRGEVAWTTTIRSTASGVVTNRAVTEGAYVKEGTLLLEVVDLSSVWVLVSVYESDANNVASGMRVQVTGPSLGGEVLQGVVDYVYPSVDPESRTVQVRAQFANTGTRLKPGMYLSGTITKAAKDVLAVPAGAVIRTGKRALVYVEVEENMFEAREVQVGMKAGGFYEITGGDLKSGDRVVAEGGYLLDSERQLSAGTGGGHEH